MRRVGNVALVGIVAILALTIVNLASRPPAPCKTEACQQQIEEARNTNGRADRACPSRGVAEEVNVQPNPAQSQRQKKQNASCQRWWTRLVDFLPFEGWVALFTATLFAVGVWQACIHHGQLRHFRSVERPWLLMHSSRPEKGDEGVQLEAMEFSFDGKHRVDGYSTTKGPGGVMVHWQVTNHGKAPARVTKICADIVVGGIDLPKKPFPYERTETVPHLAITTGRPHGHVTWVPLTTEQWSRYFGATGCLVFWGFVEYVDQEGRPHYTRFCETWLLKQPGHLDSAEFRPVGPKPAWTRYT